MHKAITVILFKLEGQKVMRCPEFGMNDRLLLDKIDYENKTVTIGEKTYPLEDCDFPTVDPADPYTLTPEESQVIDQLPRRSSAAKSCKSTSASCIPRAGCIRSSTATCSSTAASP